VHNGPNHPPASPPPSSQSQLARRFAYQGYSYRHPMKIGIS
jgi:hypothetical protein